MCVLLLFWRYAISKCWFESPRASQGSLALLSHRYLTIDIFIFNTLFLKRLLSSNPIAPFTRSCTTSIWNNLHVKK